MSSERYTSQVQGARSSTDRASDYGSEGWEFESLRAHFFYGGNGDILFLERVQCHKNDTDEPFSGSFALAAMGPESKA